MSSYTQINLNDVENQAPNFRGSGRLKLDDGVEYVAFGAPLVEDKRAEVEMLPGWWQD